MNNTQTADQYRLNPDYYRDLEELNDYTEGLGVSTLATAALLAAVGMYLLITGGVW